MIEASPGTDSCPHCRTGLTAFRSVEVGPHSHDPGTGFHSGGRRLKASPGVHALLGRVMKGAGSPVCDRLIADAMGYRGTCEGPLVASVTTHARSAFRAAVEECPFDRVRGEGLAWRTGGERMAVRRDRMEMCPSCGYDLVPNSVITCGRYRHESSTGTTYVDDVPLNGTPRIHAMVGTYMRGGGAVIPSYVVAERMGSESEDPAGLVTAMVHLMRRAAGSHGAELPLECVWGAGYRWTGGDAAKEGVTGGTS